MVSALDSVSSGPGSGPGARFSKVPKTFRARNCQLLVLESKSFKICFQGNKKKITMKFDELNALRS